MDVFLINHRPIAGQEAILPESCQKWLLENSVKRVTLLTIQGMEDCPLESEIRDLVTDVELETLELPRIGLGNKLTPSELSNLPWMMLTSI